MLSVSRWGAVRPPIGRDAFRYRLYTPDGDELGEATYAQMIHLGEEIHFEAGKRYRVVDVVVYGEDDESSFVGLLQVEAA